MAAGVINNRGDLDLSALELASITRASGAEWPPALIEDYLNKGAVIQQVVTLDATLGTMALQDADNVDITGGSISGVTLEVEDIRLTGSILLGGNPYDLTIEWANPSGEWVLSIPDPGGNDTFVFANLAQTLINKTIDGDDNTLVDIHTDSLKDRTGIDTDVVTGTAGTDGNLGMWNADGDMVDSGLASSDVLTNIRVSAGTTSNLLSAITFADSGQVSFGLNASTVTASVAAVGLNTAQSNVTWTVNSSGISLDGRGYAGTGTTFNGANVSGSMTVDSAGVALSLSADTGAGGLTNINISAGTTSNNLSALVFENSNGVSFGLNGSTITATVQTNYLTTAMASNRGTDFVQATAVFHGTNASGTIASGAISVSVDSPAGSSWTVSDPATSGTVGQLAFTNLNGVTLSLSTGAGGSHTIVGSHNALTSQSNQGLSAPNGSFTFQTAQFHNSNGVSWSSTTGSGIVASVNTSYRASNDGVGLNTAQTNVTWTVNSSGISLNAGGYAGTGTALDLTNLTGTLSANSAGVSLSLSADAAGGAGVTLSNLEPFPLIGGTATTTGGLQTVYIEGFTAPQPVSFGQVNMIGSLSLATQSAPFTLTGPTLGTNATTTITGNARFGHSVSDLIGMVVFDRGTGVFSSCVETLKSSLGSLVSVHDVSVAWSLAKNVASTVSLQLSQTYSAGVVFPVISSATSTTLNPATTATVWGTGYSTITQSSSSSSSLTYNRSASTTLSVSSPFPATTLWQSNKMIPLPFAGSLDAGNHWLGRMENSSSSSSSTSNGSGNYSYGGSMHTASKAVTWAGMTNSISNSLGWVGQQSTSTMAPAQGDGYFGTYDPASTYINNAGNPNGALAFTQISSNTSYFRPWIQFASNRI